MPKYGGAILTFFETVKNSVTVKQAAEHYGCEVNRGDMICCPFHDDRHPSMKLNEDYFYCFGCGVTGDVIDFVARLFGLSSYEAAKKLAYFEAITKRRNVSPFSAHRSPDSGSRNCAHAASSRADTARTGKNPVFPRSRIFRRQPTVR